MCVFENGDAVMIIFSFCSLFARWKGVGLRLGDGLKEVEGKYNDWVTDGLKLVSTGLTIELLCLGFLGAGPVWDCWFFVIKEETSVIIMKADAKTIVVQQRKRAIIKILATTFLKNMVVMFEKSETTTKQFAFFDCSSCLFDFLTGCRQVFVFFCTTRLMRWSRTLNGNRQCFSSTRVNKSQKPC